jgi:nucleoside phosphorylase
MTWPKGREPTPAPLRRAPAPNDALSEYDYLIVTWTAEEAKCLADTLTPGYPSKTAWYDYTHKFESDYVPIIRRGAPSVQDSHRLGSYFPTMIGGKRAVCFKSELHMSQDGPKLPIAKLWAQLIAEAKPKLVITTGTAGGIGPAIALGDVVVAPEVRFDCTAKFKNAPFHSSVYSCSKVKTTSFPMAQQLFKANAGHLPPAARPPRIFTEPVAGVKDTAIVTTDFFAFDDTSNTFGLSGLGLAVEMGDAVLGMVVQQMGPKAPKWAAVRNASDPQIDSTGLTKKEAETKAGQIYERFGYWTTIPSAITCWALVLDN